MYVSCERIFDPSLEGKAVVVLSNSDRCVVARSDAAKELRQEASSIAGTKGTDGSGKPLMTMQSGMSGAG